MAILELNVQNFDKEVLAAKGTVLVDFWAAWCGPCRMLAPTIDEIAEEMPDVKVCKVNVDEQEALAMRYGIMSIPTLLVFRDGEPVDQSLGVQPKQAILEMLK